MESTNRVELQQRVVARSLRDELDEREAFVTAQMGERRIEESERRRVDQIGNGRGEG